MELVTAAENLENKQEFMGSEIELSLTQLASQIQKRGYNVLPYSPAALNQYGNLPEEKRQQLAFVIGQVSKVMGLEVEAKGDGEDHPEKEHVLMALKFFGMELRDDVWKHISPEEIIEIYDKSDIQVFRTLNFFKASSYTLLDLLTHEWFHLWERPTVILEKMMNLGQRLHSTINGIEQAGIPRHVLKEILSDETHGLSSRKSIQIDFNVVCPLYRKGSDERAGYIVTCLAKIMEQGKEVDNIMML